MAEITFTPFGNESESLQAGPGEGLTFENGLDAIAVYGDMEIERSAANRARLDELIEALTRVRDSLPKA